MNGLVLAGFTLRAQETGTANTFSETVDVDVRTHVFEGVIVKAVDVTRCLTSLGLLVGAQHPVQPFHSSPGDRSTAGAGKQ